MKRLESETVWKDGKLVTMYREHYPGIFADQECWISQKTLDRIQYQLRQAKEARERRNDEKESKKISSFW